MTNAATSRATPAKSRSTVLSWPAWLATCSAARWGSSSPVRTGAGPAGRPGAGRGGAAGHAAARVVQEGGAEPRVDGADERERLDPPLGGDPHAVALAQAEVLGGGRVEGGRRAPRL